MTKPTNRILDYGEQGGDKTERNGWPLFAQAKFPNYELFWSHFVVPRTDRPLNIHLSSNTSSQEGEIASIHYSIFSSFYVVYAWLASVDGSPEKEEQSFEYSCMKLSNICDLVEELLFKILILRGEVSENYPWIQGAVTIGAKEKKIGEIEKLSAGVVFKDLKYSGTSSIRIANRAALLAKKFSLKSYSTHSQDIRNYRNIIVHSWQSFKINGKVPNIAYVKKYQDWVAVTEIIKSKDDVKKTKMVRDEFVPMRTLIQQQTDKLIHVVNELWNEAIPLLPPPPASAYYPPGMIGDSIRTTASGVVNL
jgi:hypothetical protein